MIVDGFFRCLVDCVIHLHNGSLVSASVTVVWSGEHGYDCPVVLPLIPFHNKLMSPSDKVQSVDVGKLFRDVLSKRISSAPRRDSPSATVCKGYRRES
jgi:hypothetical protein